jgi:pyrroline-5-carboxylate reductase
MLAVKPQQSADLFSNIRPLVNPKQMIISIMAGATIETIQKSLGINKVVRAMPNLPAQIGKGMTAYCPDRSISQEDLNIVQDVLSSTGKAIQVNNENAIDASTGISGSGPAYVFYFMQAMMQAATELGFDEQESKELVCQTFDGAVSLFQENNLNTQEWMNRVASKGGTTRAALDSFESNNVGQHIKEGAIAAYTRAVELGRMK